MVGLPKQTRQISKVVAAIVVIGTTPAAVVSYIDAEKMEHQERVHAIEIKDLKQQLGTIERRLGGEDEPLDVRELWLTTTEIAEYLDKAIFYQSDRFYAPGTDERWTYKYTSDRAILERQIKDEVVLQQLLGGLPDHPMHLWEGRYKHEIRGSRLVKSVFPFVTVDRIALKKLSGSLERSIEVRVKEGDLSGDDAVAMLEDYFRSDLVLRFFINHFATVNKLARLDDGLHASVLKLQQRGNVLYAQMKTTLTNVIVGDRNASEYYVIEEIIFISTDDDLYVINTSVPTFDMSPRDEYFGYVTRWLGEFAIVRQD